MEALEHPNCMDSAYSIGGLSEEEVVTAATHQPIMLYSIQFNQSIRSGGSVVGQQFFLDISCQSVEDSTGSGWLWFKTL